MATGNGTDKSSINGASASGTTATLSPDIAQFISAERLHAVSNGQRAEQNATLRATAEARWGEMIDGTLPLNLSLPGRGVELPAWMKDSAIVTGGLLRTDYVTSGSNIGGRRTLNCADRGELRWVRADGADPVSDPTILRLYHSDAAGNPCADGAWIDLDPDEAYRMLGVGGAAGQSWEEVHCVQPFSYTEHRVDARGRPIGYTLLCDCSGHDRTGKSFSLGVKRFFMSRNLFGQLCDLFLPGSISKTILSTKLGGRLPQTLAEADWFLAHVVLTRTRRPEWAVGFSGLNVTTAIPVEVSFAKFLNAPDGLAQFKAYRLDVATTRAKEEAEGRSFSSQPQQTYVLDDAESLPIG